MAPGRGNRDKPGDVAGLPPPPPRPVDGRGDLGGSPAAAAGALLSAPAPGASSPPLEAVLAVFAGLLAA